ncbi:PAS domain-containing sensor histidine kinase [Ammoniphilus resinae]|uniref:histidine kinase n=1 Tax=Ammoniphilus resinae TaxID=861532 RepID=A0ABS4GR08_9BACL|nr:PAS domain S-box-containing protein [Ammoniphilus resinae]
MSNQYEGFGQDIDVLLSYINDHNFSDQVMENVRESLKELTDLKYALDVSTIVAITDARGKIKYVNDKFCEISQYTREELLGRDHRIINSGYHSKEFMRKLWETILCGQVWKGDIKNRAKDGTYYWVKTTIVPFLNQQGKPYQFLAIRTEITEAKRNEEELKKSLEELVDLKFALDESSIVAITDAKGKIKYVNDKFCEVSKYTREELLGQDHQIINSGYHSKDFFRALWQTIREGHVWKGEIKNRAKDGTYYWVDTTIVPFLDVEGVPYQYLAIRSEITERKRVEEELQRMTAELMRVQEEERKRVSRDLHDGIGQSMYTLLITIDRLAQEVAGDHPILQDIRTQAENIVNDIRSISWELRPSVLDDLGLVPALRSYIQRFIEFHGINVHLECTLKKRLSIQIETAIYRIIQEALNNIRKYAGVKEAYVYVLDCEKYLEVRIEDQGEGFSPETSVKGVGLFSMQERAKAVEGQMDITSQPEKGTKIRLQIPMG